MKLEEFALIYFANHEYGIRETSKNCHYLPACRAWQKATSIENIEDVTEADFNKFVDWLRSQPLSPHTMRSRRQGALTLLLAAYDAGIVKTRFYRLRKIRVPRTAPSAWSLAQVQHLVQTIDDDKSSYDGMIAYRDFWSSLVLTAWDTALRLGDLLAMHPSAIKRGKNGTATACVLESKTNKLKLVAINRCTLKRIDDCLAGPHRSLIWPLRQDRRQFYRDFKAILDRAKLQGTFRYLRRSSITFAESLHPGDGQLMGQHESNRTTRDSYLDPTLLPRLVIEMPPVID